MGNGQIWEADHPFAWDRPSLECYEDMTTPGKPSLATPA